MLPRILRALVRPRRLLGLVLLASVVAAGYFWWPRRGSEVGYPFGRAAPGALGSPLWRMSPEVLDRLTADDTARLRRTVRQLDKALELARSSQALLAEERVEALDATSRQRVRDLWWSFLEPMVALDELKHRYDGWYGIDFLAHPRLHARSFAISFTALCAQTSAGHALLELIGGKELAPKLFDEAMPELGLPAGTFADFRSKLGRTRDHSLVPLGAHWFEQWLARHLAGGSVETELLEELGTRRTAALNRLGTDGAARTVENEGEVLKSTIFQAWFPIQKAVAEWAGDTRIAPNGRRLISDDQIAEMKKSMRPGDIIVERRNWYLSNVGLPGFWPHAALYAGTQEEIRERFDGEPSVVERFGTFSETMAQRHPEGWRALGEKDAQGHPHTIIEAVSEGVVASSIEHSCGADYAAALRPTVALVEVATALDRALGYFGRPYDFDFDFATDDQVVCSELVVKAYEPATADGPGLRPPWITVAGRRAVPPTELVRLFASERGTPEASLDFVYFLDGREWEKKAVVGDGESLAKSIDRPKWDVAQR